MYLEITIIPRFCVYFDIDSKREVSFASIRKSIADVSGVNSALSHRVIVL